MLSEASDETLVSETKDIFQNTSVSYIGGDFNTISYVWDTNINACFEPFRSNTQSKAPITSETISASTLFSIITAPGKSK